MVENKETDWASVDPVTSDVIASWKKSIDGLNWKLVAKRMAIGFGSIAMGIYLLFIVFVILAGIFSGSIVMIVSVVASLFIAGILGALAYYIGKSMIK